MDSADKPRRVVLVGAAAEKAMKAMLLVKREPSNNKGMCIERFVKKKSPQRRKPLKTEHKPLPSSFRANTTRPGRRYLRDRRVEKNWKWAHESKHCPPRSIIIKAEDAVLQNIHHSSILSKEEKMDRNCVELYSKTLEVIKNHDFGSFYDQFVGKHLFLQILSASSLGSTILVVFDAPDDFSSFSTSNSSRESVRLFCSSIHREDGGVVSIDPNVNEWPREVGLSINRKEVTREWYSYSKNTITLTWGMHPGRNSLLFRADGFLKNREYVMSARVVRTLTVDELIDFISQNQTLSCEESMKRIFGSFQNDSNDDEEEEELQHTRMDLGLLCPLSLKLMNIPVRGRKCRHFQCFDLRNWLQLNNVKEGNAKWVCPICQSPLSRSDLIVDEFVKNIIFDQAMHRESVSGGTVRVESVFIHRNGEFKLNERCVGGDNDDEHDDDDDGSDGEGSFNLPPWPKLGGKANRNAGTKNIFLSGNSRVDFISCLPEELARLILSLIPPVSRHVQNVARCCSCYNSVISDPVVWKKHLQRHFPHLMNSSFCIRYFLDMKSPKRPAKKRKSFEQWVDGLSGFNKQTDVPTIPDRKSKRFFQYLYSVSKKFHYSDTFRNMVIFIALTIRDFHLLRSLMSFSLSNRRCTLTIDDMSFISSCCPREFPSTNLGYFPSEGRSVRFPLCGEYVFLMAYHCHDHRLDDLAYEKIMHQSRASIKGVRMLDVSALTMVRCMASLRLEGLKDFELKCSHGFAPNEGFPSVLRFAWKQMKSLDRISITGCEVRNDNLDAIFRMKHLKCLSLVDCPRMKEIPESIGGLSELERLELSEVRVRTLPSSIGHLSCLKELRLTRCFHLATLPESITSLVGLRELDLIGCVELRRLPMNLGALLGLQKMNLHLCSSLRELPESIGNLKNLEELILCECVNLKEFPRSIGGLSKLKELNAGHCIALESLPRSIENLKRLEELNLSECCNLVELPTAISGLQSLRELDLHDCFNLDALPIESLEFLTKLSMLDIEGCVQDVWDQIPPSMDFLLSYDDEYEYEYY